MILLKPGDKNVCFPCGTKNYGCAITPAFEMFPCSSIRHTDCYFDLRALGVNEAIRRMKAFMRKSALSHVAELRLVRSARSGARPW